METQASLCPALNFWFSCTVSILPSHSMYHQFYQLFLWLNLWLEETPKMLEFLFQWIFYPKECVDQAWSISLREDSQLTSDNSIAVEYCNLLTSEWAHGTDWDLEGWPGAGMGKQGTCLITQRRLVTRKSFPFALSYSSQLGEILLITGLLSLIVQSNFGQMTFMDIRIYFVKVEATIRIIEI